MEDADGEEKRSVWCDLVHHLAGQVVLFDDKSSSMCRFQTTLFNDFFGDKENFEKWLDMEQSCILIYSILILKFLIYNL